MISRCKLVVCKDYTQAKHYLLSLNRNWNIYVSSLKATTIDSESTIFCWIYTEEQESFERLGGLSFDSVEFLTMSFKSSEVFQKIQAKFRIPLNKESK